jgi:NADPH:quinone reductase
VTGMLAAWCARYGSPDVVTMEEVPAPEPGPGHVVVDVAAAAVNFPDVLLVADRYQAHVDVPFIPGSEFAGTVRSVGPGVQRLNVGDRVMGTAIVGCFAEQVAVPAGALQPVPDALSLDTAAAAGVAYRTAHHCLRSVARMEPGDHVVVLGAAGGVGLATVELATVLGGRVVAVASTDEKRAACRAKGSVSTVDSHAPDLKDQLKAATGGGADVVVDPAGGGAAEAAIRATRWGGRFVTVGFASGEIPKIPLNLLLLKGVVVTGFTLSGLMAHQPDDVARDNAELTELLATGQVAPHVGARFPLSEAGAALAELAQRRAIGKVLVIPGA